MDKASLVILAICVACATGASLNRVDLTDEFDRATRIVGGENATKGQFPYQVSLRIIKSKVHYCGGSIISSRFIVTAAHCTLRDYANPANVEAVVGALSRSQDGVVVRLSKLFAHERYNAFQYKNDISLIRTLDEIVFSDTIQPIALPTQNIDGDIHVILSGWGRLQVNYCVFFFPTPDFIVLTFFYDTVPYDQTVAGYSAVD